MKDYEIVSEKLENYSIKLVFKIYKLDVKEVIMELTTFNQMFKTKYKIIQHHKQNCIFFM